MTAQISDKFKHRDCQYSVASISEGKLFEPMSLDLKPVVGGSMGCWRGYQAIYSIVDNHLVVADLHVNLFKEGDKNFKRLVGPPINGVRPTGHKKFDLFNHHYEGINYHLEYSGGLLLANGFIDDLYVHGGFHPAWKYEHVIELVFRNGMFEGEFDRSERMAEIRDSELSK